MHLKTLMFTFMPTGHDGSGWHFIIPALNTSPVIHCPVQSTDTEDSLRNFYFFKKPSQHFLCIFPEPGLTQ